MRAVVLSMSLVGLLAANSAVAQPTPANQDWIIPPTPPAPPPPPPPLPSAVVALPADELFVLDCREACFFLVSPPGIVEVTQSAGPFTAFAKFYGGSGKAEMKTFAGPVVIAVRSVGTGRATLTVVKAGAKSPADVYQQFIDGNTGPLPPPVPPVPPPVPPDDPLVVTLRAVYGADQSPTKQADVRALAAVFRAWAAKANDPAFTMYRQFNDAVAAEAQAKVPLTRVRPMRDVVNAEVVKLLGPNDVPMTPEFRGKLKAAYERIASAYEEVGR